MAGRVLVTGANGFVGGALVARLADSGCQVPVAGCRRDSVVPKGAVLALIPSLGPDADWSDALHGAEAVVHAAARVHVIDESAGDMLSAYRHVNVEGTLALARQAALSGVRRFIFVSSVKVNGERTAPSAAFTEADAPAPEDLYGLSKAEAEAGLFALGCEMGMEIVVVRPPLVHGPGVGGNFGRLLRWVERGVPLPLGSVDNRRSLVGLDNLVDLLVRCIHHPAAVDQTFLVSDGEDLSTADLIRQLARAMGKSPRLLPVPVSLLRLTARMIGKSSEVDRLVGSLRVDSAYTRERLGWIPPASLQAGLRKTAEWYVAQRSIKRCSSSA